jgi:hypothetical protein
MPRDSVAGLIEPMLATVCSLAPSFDISEANPNPPASGSVSGYVVASNFPDAVPSGVQRAHNTIREIGR